MSQTEDAFSDNLPVLVYFHGGAFVVGSNRDGPLQPEHLGLVIFSQSHRGHKPIRRLALTISWRLFLKSSQIP